jgi:hypothetical protein
MVRAGLLEGCGNLTAGGAPGEAEARVSGDADGAFASPTGAPASTRRDPYRAPPSVQPLQSIVVGALEGTLVVDLTISLETAAGATYTLTPDGSARGQVDLGGAGDQRVALQTIPAEAYSDVHIVFTSVQANVTGGLLIDGLPFVGPVTVTLPGGVLAVSRSLAFQVQEGERTVLLVDLDAAGWLSALDPLTGSVDGAAFAAEVEVLVP